MSNNSITLIQYTRRDRVICQSVYRLVCKRGSPEETLWGDGVCVRKKYPLIMVADNGILRYHPYSNDDANYYFDVVNRFTYKHCALNWPIIVSQITTVKKTRLYTNTIINQKFICN